MQPKTSPLRPLLAALAVSALLAAGCGEKKPDTAAAAASGASAAAAEAAAAKAKADSDAQAAKVKEAVQIATDAYVYGYSLLTTDVTRIQMSGPRRACSRSRVRGTWESASSPATDPAFPPGG